MCGGHVASCDRGAVVPTRALAPAGLAARPAARFALRHIHHPLAPALRSGWRVAIIDGPIVLDELVYSTIFRKKLISGLKLSCTAVQVCVLIQPDICFPYSERR
jgi:hypothetical protein